VAGLLLFVIPTFAWGPVGHSLVARIAESQLTPAARARVQGILGPGRTMASVASWADEVRSTLKETGAWHFVDIPIGQARFDATRDCPKGDCVIAQVSRLRGVLGDPAASAGDRREALQFLIHFIADMHQPLHSADNHDRGGNTVEVQFHDHRTNLHSLWDSGLLDRLGGEEQIFLALSQEAARRRKGWAKGTVIGWAEESHAVGRKVVYGKLPKAGDGGVVTIDAGYEAMAAPVLREQLERAGARLAMMLNEELK
jgi:S1/P1 Nuclease